MTKVIIRKTWKDKEKISLVPGVRMTRINREVYRNVFRFGTEKYVHHLFRASLCHQYVGRVGECGETWAEGEGEIMYGLRGRGSPAI